MKKIISLFACMACCATFLFSNTAGTISSGNLNINSEKTIISNLSANLKTDSKKFNKTRKINEFSDLKSVNFRRIGWYVGQILGSKTICSGESAGTLFFEVEPSTTVVGIQWQVSLNNSIWINVNGYGLEYSPGNLIKTSYYRCIVTGDDDIQKFTNTVTITVYPIVHAGTITGAKTICPNNSAGTLSFSNSPGGGTGSGYAYQWQVNSGSWTNISGATSPSYSPGSLTSTKEYRCMVITSCGSFSTNSQVITVTALSPGTITGAKTICYNTNAGILSFIVSPSGGTNISYQWQVYSGSWTNISSATFPNYSPGILLTTNEYRCIVTNNCGSTATSNTQIITVQPDLNAGTIAANGLDIICENSQAPNIQFTSNPSGEPGAYAYQWQSSPDNSIWTNISGAINLTYTPGILANSVYYRCNVTGACNVTKSSSLLKINVISANTISTPQTDIAVKYCKSKNFTIHITNPNSKNNWYNSAQEFIQDSTTYTIKNFQTSKKVFVEAMDEYGCKSEKVALDINVDPIKADFFVTPIEIKVQDSAEFRSTSIGAVNYDWNFGDGMPKGAVSNLYAYYYKAGFFDASLTVTSDIGCTDTKTILEAVHVGVTGINLKNNETLFVYPIPVSDMLTVEYSGNSASSAFIYTLNGQLIKELKLDKTKNSINMSAYPNGAYILKVVSGEGEIYSKTLIKGE